MKHFQHIVVSFLLHLIIPVLPSHALEPREIAKLAAAASVTIITGNSQGSGVFIATNLLLTNAHVVAKSSQIRYQQTGRTSEQTGNVVAIDPDTDLALIRTDAFGGGELVIGDENALSVGDSIFVLGTPLGFDATFSNGIVAALRQEGTRRLLQITAPISPGSSGGPVMDSTGRLVGIATSTITGGQSLNFAIPASVIRNFVSKETVRSFVPSRPLPAKLGTFIIKRITQFSPDALIEVVRSNSHALDSMIGRAARDSLERYVSAWGSRDWPHMFVRPFVFDNNRAVLAIAQCVGSHAGFFMIVTEEGWIEFVRLTGCVTGLDIVDENGDGRNDIVVRNAGGGTGTYSHIKTIYWARSDRLGGENSYLESAYTTGDWISARLWPVLPSPLKPTDILLRERGRLQLEGSHRGEPAPNGKVFRSQWINVLVPGTQKDVPIPSTSMWDKVRSAAGIQSRIPVDGLRETWTWNPSQFRYEVTLE